MTSEKIEQFLSKKANINCLVRISFRTRSAFSGFFITTQDSNELKLKNFWRIISQSNYEQWKVSKDFNLCRLLNGADFSKLTLA